MTYYSHQHNNGASDATPGLGQRGYVLGQHRRIVAEGAEAQNLVRAELLARFKFRRMESNGISVNCPFHPNSGRSTTLSVNLVPHTNAKGVNIPTGLFHCWSCGKAGDWNTLAEHVGMQKLVETDNFEIGQSVQTIKYETPYEVPDDKHFREMKPGWDWVRKDGTITHKTLKSVGARIQISRETRTGRIVKDRRLWFPVFEFGDIVAHIGAALKNQDPKYLNSSGSWAHAHFYNLDAAVSLSESWHAKGYKRFCFVVEGPADALVLKQNGIPAVANIGTDTWSQIKASLLILKFDYVFALGDGDAAGRKLNKAIKESLDEHVDVKGIRLDDGADPASMSEADLKWLKSLIRKYAKQQPE